MTYQCPLSTETGWSVITWQQQFVSYFCCGLWSLEGDLVIGKLNLLFWSASVYLSDDLLSHGSNNLDHISPLICIIGRLDCDYEIIRLLGIVSVNWLTATRWNRERLLQHCIVLITIVDDIGYTHHSQSPYSGQVCKIFKRNILIIKL
jgi:hypothetical protein